MKQKGLPTLEGCGVNAYAKCDGENIGLFCDGKNYLCPECSDQMEDCRMILKDEMEKWAKHYKLNQSPQTADNRETTPRESVKGENQSRAESSLGEVMAGNGFKSHSKDNQSGELASELASGDSTLKDKIIDMWIPVKDVIEFLKDLKEMKFKRDQEYFEYYDQLVKMFGSRSNKDKFMELLDKVLNWDDIDEEIDKLSGLGEEE